MPATITDSKTTATNIELTNDLLRFFDERGGLPGNSLDEQLDLPLFEAGVISSVGLVELVMYLEQRYKIELDPEELQGPDFQTCRGIIRIIERRTSA